MPFYNIQSCVIYMIDWVVFFSKILSRIDVWTYSQNHSGVYDTLLPWNWYRAYYTLFSMQSLYLILCVIFICFLLSVRINLMVIIVIKFIKTEKCVMCRAWWRLKSVSCCAIKKVSEYLAYIRFVFHASEFHVWYCFHSEKCLSEVILI